LCDEITLDEAAREIAGPLARDGVWGLLWNHDTSPEDALRLEQLFRRIVYVHGRATDDDSN
jgi:hypothetical protein